eukprot:749980-Rhodomonas_salina.1
MSATGFRHSRKAVIMGGATQSWMFLVFVFIFAVETHAQQLQEVCGSCRELEKRVQGLNQMEIVNRADREQGSGDFVGAAKT